MSEEVVIGASKFCIKPTETGAETSARKIFEALPFKVVAMPGAID